MGSFDHLSDFDSLLIPYLHTVEFNSKIGINVNVQDSVDTSQNIVLNEGEKSSLRIWKYKPILTNIHRTNVHFLMFGRKLDIPELNFPWLSDKAN